MMLDRTSLPLRKDGRPLLNLSDRPQRRIPKSTQHSSYELQVTHGRQRARMRSFLVEQLQRFKARLVHVVMHVALEIFLKEFFFDLQLFAVLCGDCWNISCPKVARLLENINDSTVLKTFPDGPECENKRQSGQETPSFGEIEHLNRLRTQAHQRLLKFDIRTLVGFHELQCIVANK